jgi:hypothetical protein
VRVDFRGSFKENENVKKRYRKEYQLMVLVGYLNVVVLVNVEKEETVSRVALDPDVLILKSLPVINMFGMFSAVILTKHINCPNK